MSIATLSSGMPTFTCCIGSLALPGHGFLRAHMSHCLHHLATSSAIPGQYTWRFTFASVLSRPRWPAALASCDIFNTFCLTPAWATSSSTSSWVRLFSDTTYSNPSTTLRLSHWAMSVLIAVLYFEISVFGGFSPLGSDSVECSSLDLSAGTLRAPHETRQKTSYFYRD